MKAKHEKILVGGIFLAVFGALYLFYAAVHPLVLYDTDDWTYIGFYRELYPTFAQWNPAKLLPEYLVPLCGKAAAILYRLTGLNYFHILTGISAFVLSALILGYVFLVYRLVKRAFGLSSGRAVLIALTFLVSHYWILKTGLRSDSLLTSGTMNFCFNYTVPAVFNAILVLWTMLRPEILDSFQGSFAQVVFFVAAYFALFSNLYGSIVLASYLFVRWCGQARTVFTGSPKQSAAKKLHSLVQKTSPLILLLLLWAVCLFFEGFGPRAAQSQKGLSLGLTLFKLMDTLGRLHPVYLASAAGLCVAGVLVWFCDREARPRFQLLLGPFFSGSITFIFLFLLSAKVEPNYIGRGDVLLSFGFYAFLFLAFLSAILFSSTLTKSRAVVYLVFLLGIIQLGDNKTAFDTVYRSVGSPQALYAVDTYIWDAVIEAGQAGETALELPVPEHQAGDNWPLSNYGGERVAGVLYRYGFIERPITVTFVPDMALNETFGITP